MATNPADTEEWGNFSDPLKMALGLHLQGFQRGLMPDTRAVLEFMRRPFMDAVKLAPDRMIDAVDEIIDAYRKNDNVPGKQPVTALPIVLVAVGKDYTPSGSEYGRVVADPIFVQIPGDKKERIFRLRVVKRDYRAQVVVMAAEGVTASSLAMQLHLYCAAMARRTLAAQHRFAGVSTYWGVQIEDPEISAISSPAGEGVKNATVLVVDMTLRATIPLYNAPGPDEPNDGLGTSNEPANPYNPQHDPSGYPRVKGLRVSQSPNADLSNAVDEFRVLYRRASGPGDVIWSQGAGGSNGG